MVSAGRSRACDRHARQAGIVIMATRIRPPVFPEQFGDRRLLVRAVLDEQYALIGEYRPAITRQYAYGIEAILS